MAKAEYFETANEKSSVYLVNKRAYQYPRTGLLAVSWLF